MRSLFLILLLANLVCFAVQFEVVRSVWSAHKLEDRPAQINAERLRVIRDTSARPATSQQSAPPGDQAAALSRSAG